MISSSHPERRGLDCIAAGAAALLDVPLIVISVLDGARQEIVGAHALAEHSLQQQEGCPACRDVALSGRPIIAQDARSRLPRSARRGWGLELVGYAGVPLVLEGGRTGTLAAFAPARRTWQSRDLLVLRSIADAASAVLDTQRRCDELGARLDQEREAREQQLASSSAAYTTLESRAADVAGETAE